MTVIRRLYASGGREVIIDTLQIEVAGDSHFLAKGWDDVSAGTESGPQVFTACGMDIALPARNADGTQDLRFALSNIDGQVSGAIQQALRLKTPMFVTYRKYVSTDLAAPAERPYRMKVKGGQWTAAQAQVVAGYMNILDTAWPRELYNLSKHPGLRYFS